MKKVMKMMGLIALLSAVLVACTKEAPYQTAFKEEVLSKSIIGTGEGEDYIYTASVLEMSRLTADGRPFGFSDSRRVQFQWTKDSLELVEKERDQRYARPENDRIVLKIPVEHIEYDCARNSFNECTSKETVKSDINWSQMKNFKMAPESARYGSLEFLPVVLDQAFGNNCYEEIGSKLKDFEVSENHMNIKVEKSYRQLCDGAFDAIDEVGFSGTGVKIVFNYSMVKAKSVLSPDFQTVQYPDTDKDTFGFFATERKVRDTDGTLTDKSLQRIMNHWNPNREVIEYHLSDSFNNPKNKKLKELSYLTVARLNEGLERAGAKFRVNLNEPSGKNPGDIRNSMIVLVEDPYQSIPLGYGPQTEDPVTGEIISARSVMFRAGFEEYAKFAYDELGRKIKRQKAAQEGVSRSLSVDPVLASAVSKSERSQSQKAQESAKSKAFMQKPSFISKADLKKAEASLKNYNSRVSDEYSKSDLKSYAKYLAEAKNCGFTVDPTSGVLEAKPELMQAIINQFGDKNGNLTPWRVLSASQRQKVIDTFLPEMWVPTLLHELGHNLGLRHNFKGSEDKENFYNPENPEDAAILAAAGIKHKMPYNSVMEYGDDLRSLTILGKYDIAALRFAYAGKLKLESGEIVEIPRKADGTRKTLEELTLVDGLKLANYGFCTDDSVGPNAGCRKFDEGTNYVEIADYLIKSYKDRFEARSTRNGADNFSIWSDAVHARNVYNRFISMRSIVESYERIRNQFSLAQNDPVIEQIDWLKDLRDASLKVNRFYLSVLETPELHCLIARTSAPSTVIGVRALSVFDPTAITCNGVRLAEGFVAIGEFGKLQNSSKDPESTNPYIDQIDVRGFWLDRWAASRALFDRSLGQQSFNRYFENAWDIEALRSEIDKTLTGLISNDLVLDADIKLFTGETGKLRVAVDTHSTGVVKQMFHPMLSKALGIEHNDNFFSGILAKNVQNSAKTSLVGNLDLGNQLFDLVSAEKVSRLTSLQGLQNISVVDPGGEHLIVAKKSNKIALGLMEKLVVQTNLSGLSSEDLALVVEILKSDVQALDVALVEKIKSITAEQVKYLLELSSKDKVAAANLIEAMANDELMTPSDLAKILIGISR